MLETTEKLIVVGLAALSLSFAAPGAYAQTTASTQSAVIAQPADNGDPVLDAAVQQLETEWARIKFTMVTGSDKQLAMMDELGKKAEALAAQYPDKPAVLIWDGIILSERASMANERNSLTGGITALRLAKQAKAVLEKAYAIDPAALSAGAATTLGVLYYRVPGFPIGFGDKDKARSLLEEAVRTAPDSLDAQYFYADFLYTSNLLPQATAVLEKALTIPQDADRPVWDHSRRLVIQQLLKEIQDKG